MTIIDYFKTIEDFYEILENDKIKRVFERELDCDIVSISKLNESENLYYFSGTIAEDYNFFRVTILFTSNDNFKNLTIRKEARDSSDFMIFDAAYSKDKKSSYMKVQKGTQQDDDYYLESLISNGSSSSYQADLYNYHLVGHMIDERRKSMNINKIFRKYSLDHITIDNACCSEVTEYKIVHNDEVKYISSDRLEETIESLLSYDTSIALCLK